MLIAAVVLMLAAILIVGVNEAAARGRLGINPLAGIRLGSLMYSERAWQEGHRAARVPMIAAGAVLFLSGLALFVLPLPESRLSTTTIVGTVVAVALVVVGGFLAKRAADRVLVDDSDE
jgi:hypothetical protein